MQIREAIESDIPGILKVLKASLGETSSKKTEKVWRYKHIDNPFGKSLVLVAEEGNKLIGVRAFMRWKWQKGEQVYSTFRAVDTATHPNHQGKGIFKKLTLRALEIAKEQGDHFVFNTPNSKSKPGYLKMGWKEVNKLKIQLRPLNPLKTVKNQFEYKIIGEKSTSEKVVNSFFEKQKGINRLFTPKNINYLLWRYVNNPLQDYSVIFDKEFFVAGYVKKRNRFNEFRVTDAIISDDGIKQAKKDILKMANASGANILSLSPNNGINFKAGVTGNFGPMLTFKNINLGEKEAQELLALSSWNYRLGELELF